VHSSICGLFLKLFVDVGKGDENNSESVANGAMNFLKIFQLEIINLLLIPAALSCPKRKFQ
jgi:hypothetical protein